MALLSPTDLTKLPLLLCSSISQSRFNDYSHSIDQSFSFPILCHRPFQPISSNSTVVCPGCCCASSPGPPPPPLTDPPPEKESRQLKGIAASFSRIQDRVQIFLAVLFWMSLLFWASAWDHWTGKKKPNKRNKFRR